MSWDSFYNAIQWFDSSNPIPTNPQYPLSEFTASEKQTITAYLQELYNGSAEARAAMDAAAALGNICLGKSTSIEPGYATQGGHYIGYNLDAIDKLYYFNDKGVLVKEKPELSIIHELIHYAYNIQGDVASTGQDASGVRDGLR